MEALFNQQPFDEAGAVESVRNIVGRYRDIEAHFPDELAGSTLPYFADWLIENVHMVEITAYSDEDAYTIFETMNDRGLSLTPADMLKGFVLANIADEDKKHRANSVWKEHVGELVSLGKDEDADALKTWLRSQYAQTIRERKKGALPGDFDRIGTEFHRWVREHRLREDLSLRRSDDFAAFIERDLAFYTRQYLRLRGVSESLTPGFDEVYFNAGHGFTLQYPLLLAPLTPGDDETTIARKVRVVATFVDILIARRLWNFRAISYSTMQYAMFLVMRDIRGKGPRELADILAARLKEQGETFASNDRLRVHQQNRYAIHELLARMTDYVEREAGFTSRFVEYVGGAGRNRYEVEHVWANDPSRHTDEFPHEADFGEYRNRIGGLLLLPKSFNASFGALPYAEKLEHYNSQNVLARSLHPACYDHNPGFLAFVQRSGLPFKPHPQFRRADLDERQYLYRLLAERVWDPQRLLVAAESAAPPIATVDVRRRA